MGVSCSKTSVDPSPPPLPRSGSQKHLFPPVLPPYQPDATLELAIPVHSPPPLPRSVPQERLFPPVPPPHRPDAMLVLATTVQRDGFIPAYTLPQPDERMPQAPEHIEWSMTDINDQVNDNTGPFLPTVRKMLPDDFRFRILVLGKRQSGKSSLINAIFNVERAAAPESQHGNADVNVPFYPYNNRYLAVHEYSGFDAERLQTIRDFITYHRDWSRPDWERLHAIWICVPTTDPIGTDVVEGIKIILGMNDMNNVPVLIVFTKFDLLVSRVQSDITPEMNEDPRAKVQAMYEDLCRSQFHRDPEDVLAVIFSEKPEQSLIDELTSITHRVIEQCQLRLPPPHSAFSHTLEPPMDSELLAWSVAQRANHKIIIQASIEVGRSQYWRNLGSSRHFANHTLKSCVNVIHEDIISVWNFDDRENYLMGGEFMAAMSRLVQDMPLSDDSSSNSPDLFLNGLYQDQHRNTCYLMTYIVDLTVILHRLFLSTRRVYTKEVQSAVKDYAESSSRMQIHEDIRSYITSTQTYLSSYQDRDLAMEKIIDLIEQNVLSQSSSYRS